MIPSFVKFEMFKFSSIERLWAWTLNSEGSIGRYYSLSSRFLVESL